MQNATHFFKVVFEGAAFVAGFSYLVAWMSGRKLTNGQVLFLFGIGFAVFLQLNLLSSIVSTNVFLIICSTPLLLSLSRTLLNSKPASQVKLMFARKLLKLPDK